MNHAIQAMLIHLLGRMAAMVQEFQVVYRCLWRKTEVFLNPRHHNEPPFGDRLVNLRSYENIRTLGHMAPMAPPGAPFKLAPDVYERNSDLEECLVNCEQLSMRNGWNKPTRAILVGLVLCGAARSVLTGLRFTQRQDFDAIVGH